MSFMTFDGGELQTDNLWTLMRVVLLYHMNKQTVTFKLSWKEERTKIQNEKRKVSYSAAFLAVGNGNR